MSERWKIIENRYGDYMVYPDAGIGRPSNNYDVDPWVADGIKKKEDALLIAAAPQMYAALGAVYDYLSVMEFEEDTEGNKMLENIGACLYDVKAKDALEAAGGSK